MTREELEALKYSLAEVQAHIETAEGMIGKVGCTHHTALARAKMDFNRLVNEELAVGRFKALK
jgi:hypothetical protein